MNKRHQSGPVALPARISMSRLPTAQESRYHIGERHGWNACLDEIAKLGPLYTHADPVCAHEWTDDGEFNLTCTKCGKQENHEPYGWVQTRGPSINQFTQEWDVVEDWEAHGIEYKALHDHPATADPGEVEQGYSHEVVQALQTKLDTLRTQLAERNALLREIHDGTLSGYARYSKIEAALSASTEPSAKEVT